ncbi:MAG: rRNA maturation RNase YbeY [Armatimonadetes bacterium]|nr:rRNA maturation RNase YbeY [Armatimonadota bacterium]
MQTEVSVKNCQPAQVNESRLVEAAAKTLVVERFEQPAEISIVLADDAQIRVLNRMYRGKDRPTDVLSFSQLEGEELNSGGEGAITLGDVVISVETAERQAAERAHSLEDELDVLVVHGVLHLLGYDDETEPEAAEMRRHERKILDQLRDGRTC